MQRIINKLRQLDPWLFFPYVILCLIGVVMVYSASAAIRMQTGGSPVAYLKKQAIFAVIGLIVAFLVYNMDLATFRKHWFLKWGTWILLAALVGVKLFGTAVNGAQGWINLGFISIQPAEVVKLYLILFLAHRLDKYNQNPTDPLGRSRLVPPVLISGAFLILIAIQPDTGGAAINAAIVLVIFMAGEIPWKIGSIVLASGTALIAFGLPVASTWLVNHMSGSYRIARFMAYVNPFGTQSGAGSQLVNSYYAISNGGLTGVGLGNGIQKMGYLPEPNTDFILAVIAEELGFVMVTIILVLLAIIICRMILLGARTTNLYEGLICYGSATFMAVESIFNIGAVSGLLPITGVTLPFISYGGSSMLVLSATMGVVLNVSRRQKDRASLAIYNEGEENV